MTRNEFCNIPKPNPEFVSHNGETKYVVSMDNVDALFGLLPEKPEDFTTTDWNKVQWVRCESVELIQSEIFTFPDLKAPLQTQEVEAQPKDVTTKGVLIVLLLTVIIAIIARWFPEISTPIFSLGGLSLGYCLTRSELLNMGSLRGFTAMAIASIVAIALTDISLFFFAP